MSDTPESTEAKPNNKKQLLIIIIALVAVVGTGGGVWFYMQQQLNEALEVSGPKKKPTIFHELDIFTVNLQPEENNQYLQVGLTIRIVESQELEDEIKKQMPAIRNRILMLLSSKTAAEISTIVGKQQLSAEITEQIQLALESEMYQEDVKEVLFTSFVIQ